MHLPSMKTSLGGKAGKGQVEKGPSWQKSDLGWLLRDELVQLCRGKGRRALQPFGSLGTGTVPLDGVQGVTGSLGGPGFPFSAVGTGKGCNGKSGSGAKTGRAKTWPLPLAELGEPKSVP